MKRSARDLELQVVAHDMVETARGVEASPVLVVLTYAIDPLLEVLRSRPILLINLMRSSRALYDAWSAIPNLWIMLLEQVMQAVRPERFRFYPFYAMQLERTWYQLHAVEKAVDWDALPNGTAALRGIEHTYDMITSRIGWSDHNGYIALDFVVNDDVVVPAYLALMRHLFYIGVALATDLWLRTPTIARDFYKNTDESIVLNVRRHKYEPFGDFLQATTWSGGWGSSSEPRQHPPELVTIMREQVQAIADELNAFGHGPLLGSEVEITRVAGESRTSTWHHPEVARALDVLVRLADRALFALNRLFAAAEEEGPEPDAYLPERVDARLAEALPLQDLKELDMKPYRDALWRFYDTPERQREMLYRELRIMGERPDNEYAIREISASLHCAACGLATEWADAQSTRAYCLDALCLELRAMHTGEHQ